MSRPVPLFAEQKAIAAVLNRMTPMQAVDVGKVRLGADGDGGYVMLDDLADVQVCYSIGVGPDVSWDHDMAERGALIHQYDHTVEATPQQHANFRWTKLGLAGSDHIAPELRTLETLIVENGDAQRTDMILKMDIEGHEFDVLDAMDPATLLRFRQIAVEIHALTMLDQESFRRRTERVLNKLGRAHQCVHVHANNYAPMTIVHGVPVPDVVEVTYARRDLYTFVEETGVFPTPFDAPNRSDQPDLLLGSFRF